MENKKKNVLRNFARKSRRTGLIFILTLETSVRMGRFLFFVEHPLTPFIVG